MDQTSIWILVTQTDQAVPSWTGFNIRTRSEEPISVKLLINSTDTRHILRVKSRVGPFSPTLREAGGLHMPYVCSEVGILSHKQSQVPLFCAKKGEIESHQLPPCRDCTYMLSEQTTGLDYGEDVLSRILKSQAQMEEDGRCLMSTWSSIGWTQHLKPFLIYLHVHVQEGVHYPLVNAWLMGSGADCKTVTTRQIILRVKFMMNYMKIMSTSSSRHF